MAKDILKDIQCKQATSGDKKLAKLPDGDGLYLWVYADGRKYWRLRYWVDGKEKTLSLGVYPSISLKDARKRRDEQRRHLEDGRDPSQERQAEKLRRQVASANTFEAVAREWYGKMKNGWVKHHADDVLRRLEKNLFPHIGKRPIGEIESFELLAAVRKIEDRGATDLAHRVLGVAGQVFRYGILPPQRCTRDLSADLRGALTPHKKKHQAAVRPEELPDLMRAIEGYDREIGDRQTRLGLELLALTFTRTNELIGAEWPEVDFDSDVWIVPAERMKMKAEHVVPLSPRAKAIFAELKELGKGSRFVFPGRGRDKPISNNTMLFALYRLGYKGKMTGHGFRAVASTMLNEMGFRPDVIERQLAHCEQNEVRGAYNRAEYLAERRKMMETWAEHLAAITAGAKVLRFKAA